MNIRDLIDNYQNAGYEYIDASSKVCQDIILFEIFNSKYSKNITIKGGVVMHNISNDIRRATRDLDFDFIKYSLEDESVRNFIEVLNHNNDYIKIEIIGKIKQLHQQDYDGKRVILKITDKTGFYLETKLDIGVHKDFDIEQEDYCFNLEHIGKSFNLLVNSKEQIFVEKLKSLLRLGIRSTRYKDLFDFYYLINDTKLNKDKLYQCIQKYIFNDEKMRENNINDIKNRLNNIFASTNFKNSLSKPKVNWLEISTDEAIESILNYLEELELTPV